MNQLDRLIENLEIRYKIPISDFLKAYEEGLSIEAMSRTFSTSQWAIRAVASALNLRLGKQFRKNDLIMLDVRAGVEADDKLVEEIKELQEVLEQLSKDLLVKDKALLRERARIRSFRKMQRDLVKFEDLEETIISIISSNVEAYEPIKRKKRQGITVNNGIQFMMLSDLHAESLVTESEVGKANEYSWNIMLERLDAVFASLIEDNQNESKLHIYLLGDLISGIIHGALEATSKHPIEAIAVLSEVLSKEIYNLATMYSEIAIFAVSGNHERITTEVKSENKGFDFGYLFHKLLEAKLSKVKHITFNISTTGLEVAPITNTCYAGLHHGDHFRADTGDLNRALRIKEAFKQQGYHVKHLLQGHTHQPKITALPTEGVEIVNGSLIGTNQYSHTKGFIGVPWSQTIGQWDEEGNLGRIKLVVG